MPKDAQLMEKLVALCKRRGFIFQSSEIYGGINGFWDYGPLGCELKRNIKEAWWQDMVRNPPVGPDGREVTMVGVDCSIIMNPKVWEASGHATGFADPMVACKTEGCKRLFREDQLWHAYLIPAAIGDHLSDEELSSLRKAPLSSAIFHWVSEGQQFSEGEHSRARDKAIRQALKGKRVVFIEALTPSNDSAFIAVSEDQRKFYVRTISTAQQPITLGDACPACGGELTAPRQFNLMFESHAGAIKDDANKVWLRPETAQGIFANFKNVCDSTRVKIPFGIAQVGKAFRNEINPRNYTFRSREFEQMEIEFFCHDKDSVKWWEWWRDVRINWYKSLGLAGEKLVPRNQEAKELAHYSKACTDIEYLFPFADEPQELEGVAHRGCFDLTAHQTASGKDLSYFDDESKERFVPTVIEPSAGADRATLAFLCDGFMVDPSRASPEFLKLHPRLAPIKAAVFPLVNKDGLPEIAEPIYRDIRKQWPAQYDPKQSIGKRYARMDEAGTPFCFTIDGQTKEDGSVTVRDRDTGLQTRIDKSQCAAHLRDRLAH